MKGLFFLIWSELAFGVGFIPSDLPSFHAACAKGDLSKVKTLLNKSNITLKDSYGHLPLFWAASQGHVSIIRILISAGADVCAKSGKEGGSILDSIISMKNQSWCQNERDCPILYQNSIQELSKQKQKCN